jgi:hypothetical protein
MEKECLGRIQLLMWHKITYLVEKEIADREHGRLFEKHHKLIGYRGSGR